MIKLVLIIFLNKTSVELRQILITVKIKRALKIKMVLKMYKTKE